MKRNNNKKRKGEGVELIRREKEGERKGEEREGRKDRKREGRKGNKRRGKEVEGK